MNQKEKSDIWSAQCAIFFGKPLDEYSSEALSRARDHIVANGGKLRPPGNKTEQKMIDKQKKNKNGNGSKPAEQLENVNLPRGRAVSEDGNWKQIIDSSIISVYLHKSILGTDKTAKISELEKSISELERTIASLQSFADRFAGFDQLTDREIGVIRQQHGI